MKRIPLGSGLAALLLVFAIGGSAIAADQYPSKPIRIIVPVPPGGAIDVTTRLYAQKMSEKLGQPIIVDDRPGGDTLLGTRLVKNSPPDGYTILAQSDAFYITPLLKLDPGYDPLVDFIPISPMLRGPLVVEVGSQEPDKTLKDFIARARATPLSYASPGIGSPPHIATELILKKVGLKMTHLPYKGAAAAYPDVAGGRVPIMLDGYLGSAPHIKAGEFRALALTSPKRITPEPDIPTLIEQGVDLSYTYWLGLLVPAGTPKDVVDRLAEAMQYASESKDLKERMISEGSDPTQMKPQEFKDYIAKQIVEVTQLVTDLNLPKQ